MKWMHKRQTGISARQIEIKIKKKTKNRNINMKCVMKWPENICFFILLADRLYSNYIHVYRVSASIHRRRMAVVAMWLCIH